MIWQDALEKILWSWDGTPWIGGQQCRGRRGGVDCVHFVDAVLNELHGYELPPLPRLPQDLGLHDRRGAFRVAIEIQRRYPNLVIRGGAVEPGDIILTREQKKSGPAHVLIAGKNPNQLWHAVNGVGVCRTSVGIIKSVLRQWRPIEREKWLS